MLSPRRFFFISLIGLLIPTMADAACDGLPSPLASTVFDSAHDYANSDEQSLDENGIVLFDYKAEYNNLGKWPNPFFNSTYAIALYRDWFKTGCTDNDLKGKFLRHADWFDKIHQNKNGMAVWTYPFHNKYFNLDAGWYSGIGQAQIASVLFIAYRMTHDAKYQKLGQQALEVYFRPPSKGGVVTTEGDDLWIQEVPDASGKPSNVLNGHITGTISLVDILHLEGKDERIESMIKRAINTVRHNIPKFDAGFTSFYSQYRTDGKYAQIAERRGYNALHIWQLLTLYEMDGDPIFLDWAMRFQAYDNINDPRSAKGSTDPVGHGPAEAAGFYLNHYWSHNDFPTWYEVSIAPRAQIDGVYLEGQTDKAMAKDFSISTYLDGVKDLHVTVSGNKDRQVYYRFKEPILADKIRIDILSDNGNGNVAMVAIMPIRSRVDRAPVANSCNHRTGGGRYAIWDAFDSDPKTMLTISCDGYITLPKLPKAGKLSIHSVENSSQIQIKTSADLKNWSDLGIIDKNHISIDIPAAVFTRIMTPKSLKQIDGITYEPSIISNDAEKESFATGFR